MKAAFALLVAALVVSGCNSGPNLQGAWVGHMELAKDFGANNKLTAAQADMIRGIAEKTTANLEIKKDEKFEFKMGNVTVTGKWELKDKTLTLVPTEGARTMVMKVESVPDRLVLDDGQGKEFGMIVFQRGAKP